MRDWTHPVHMFLGLTVWAVWFAAMYTVLSVGCAFATPSPQAGSATWINAALLAMTIITTVLLAWAGLCCYRVRQQQRKTMQQVSPQRQFSVSVSSILYGFSAASTLMVGLPVLVFHPCV